MMGSFYRRLTKMHNYMRAFGPFRGPTLCVRIEKSLAARSETVRAYGIGCAKGPIWLRDTVADHATFWQCLVRRQYEITRFPHAERLLGSYRRIVQSGSKPLIIDGGGNIGLTAIWFALTFPEAQIISVEPNQANFDLLSRNVAPYGAMVRAIKGGLWPVSKKLRIKNPESGAAAFRVEEASEADQEAIQAYSINELLALSDDQEALIVKLDIEGSQSALFQQNTEWVARTHLIILELDDWLFPWQGTSRSFFSCVSQYPFEYLISGELIFCFRNFSKGP